MDNPYAIYQKPTIRPTLKNPSPEGDYAVYDPTGTVSALPTKPNGIENPYAHYDKPTGNPYAQFSKPTEDKATNAAVDNREGIVDGFIKPTLKAIPRVITHTAASMAQMPISGVAAGAKLISTRGDLTAANKVLEENQQAVDNFYLTTDEERKGVENISLAMKPFQMAGEGLQEIVKQTPLKGTIAEPIAGTVGEASAIFGLGGAKNAAYKRAGLKNLEGVIPEKQGTPYAVTPEVKLKENPYSKFSKPEEAKADLPSVETVTKPSEAVLNDINPTGKVFGDYTPEARAKMLLGENITTLDKTMGKSPDDTITIYRGTSSRQNEIVAGDFITTNKQLAKDYAGNGTVLEKKVKLSDILDDKTESLGEEYIYRPNKRQEAKGATTGVKNAIVDKERAARGLEPLDKQTATDPFEVTKAKVDSGELDPRKLAKDTVEKPRALTVEETDALIYDRQILKNEHKSIQSQIDEAIKLGDNEAEMKLLEKRSVVEENLDTLDRAADLSGTKSGQSLQARVKEIQEDYSLANMLTRARSDNGGKPLSETARKKYEDFAKRIEAANLKIKQYEDKIAAFEAQKAVGKIRNEVALEHRKIKRAATKVELDIELDSLVKELNASLGNLHANPVFNAEVYTAFGKIAKNRVKAGYNTMEGLVDEVYTITKNAGLNFTKREVSDAISKYGVTSQLSKDEINVQLRELKRQMRLTSALEDAQKGITPLRSGLTRDAKTEKVLKLEKEVRQAMQENGIDVTKVKSEEEQWKTALQSFKTRTKNRITELEQKINTGDFTTKKRRDLALDKEALDLKFKKDQVIKEYHKARALDTLARRTTLEKAKDMGIEAVNTVRAIKTSVDLSAVLRQGGFIVLGHPVRGIKAMPSMFKALRSEKGQFAVEQEILKRANYKLYEDAGLYLSEHGQKLSQMEEVYMSQWMDYNKGVLGKVLAPVRASGRAYTTYLNRLRADSFDAMLKNLPTVAGKANPVEMKAIANFINVATGRGNLGLKEGALVGLNTVFFAPRYVLSRFQLMYGQPFKGGTRVTKQMVAKEYARFLAGIAVVYSLAIASGAKVGIDPHSSDFGKIIIGNTRLDPMVGLSQTATFTTRVLTGDKSAYNKGRTLSLDGVKGSKPKEMSAEEYGRVVSNFLRSKIAPVPGTAWNWKTKKDVIGNKIERVGDAEDFLHGTSIPSNLVMPLALSDIYQTMQQQGIPKGTALSLLSIFGMGMQTYNKK